MPTYEYRIEDTGDVVQATHTIALTPVNWGELCELCALDPEDIPLESTISKVMNDTQVLTLRNVKKTIAPKCIVCGGCQTPESKFEITDCRELITTE